ncbi:type VI secretion system tube protein Hcp [Marinihelvus fidelis]|uniref:Type VI secretion system tube protein Hcp n=1 Tax=Marinihelvus fidelis TaxID=2613842 RepID=A0A5N0T5E7_9GAMM|nr:type VI secretion system tube protein Hcp [Marinihelvus fidelis]KAA9130173.1 type VI secretion system tube protein Hcp [Marinihelvus fidelis]
MVKLQPLLFSFTLFTGLALAPGAFADVSAYIYIPDIPGESNVSQKEGWIDLASFHYPVIREESAQVGRGRARGRAEVGPVMMGKWADSASVYINLATLQGKVFDEVIVEIYQDSGETRHLQFRYTFRNVTFTSYTSEMATGGERVHETFGMTFEELRVLYIELDDDHSAGDEHEIEYDIAAGV